MKSYCNKIQMLQYNVFILKKNLNIKAEYNFCNWNEIKIRTQLKTWESINFWDHNTNIKKLWGICLNNAGFSRTDKLLLKLWNLEPKLQFRRTEVTSSAYVWLWNYPVAFLMKYKGILWRNCPKYELQRYYKLWMMKKLTK